MDKKKKLQKHSKHHSKKHMKEMKSDMKKGDSFLSYEIGRAHV